MGAWGVLAFDNDDANDWAYRLDKVKDLSLVESALSHAEEEGDYLEAPTACEALAACEVLARLLGRPGYNDAYTKTVDEWVARHPLKPAPPLLARATAVINRVLGKNSELRELWDEGDSTDWLAAVGDLRDRLRP
jgi:Domain of unknown function (DUF4259)